MTDVISFEVESGSGRRIGVNVPSSAGLFADIGTRFDARRGFALATLNLDHLVKMRLSPAFRRAYAEHDLIVADGNPIVWLSQLARRRIDLVPGCELIGPLCARAVRKGVPTALLGATQEALDAAADRLSAEHPGLRVALRRAPAQGFDPTGPEADACIEALRLSRARLCFIALGAPKQEIFAAYARRALPEVGFVSIGAGIDFIAGTQVRAPVWMRRAALEWLWRLTSNPRRLAPRYYDCARILPGLIWDALRSRGGYGAARPGKGTQRA